MQNSVIHGLRVALICLAVIALALPAAAQGNQPINIAVVDLDFVVSQSPAGQALGKRLEEFKKAAQAEAEGKQKLAADLRNRIRDGVNSLSEDKLAELQKQLEDAAIEIRRFGDDKQREGQKMQDEGLRAIEKQLEPVFAKIRDENGYDLILNRVPGVVVMAGERVDITKKVIEALQAGQ